MSNLDLLVPPRREDRHPATCLAYGGTLCGSGRKGKKKCALMADADRGFTQGTICPLLPAMGMMLSLPDTAVLMHSAVGCGSMAHGTNGNVRSGHAARRGRPADGLWFSTALDEVDVISGGDAKLERAIREIDAAYSPQAIFVVAGCLPAIIGDDIDAVTARVRPEVNARLLPVHCEGFKSRFMATAYDVVYHALGRNLVPEPDLAGPREEKTINIMNVSSMGRVDEQELERLAGELGLKANIFPVFSRPESFRKAAVAALSVSTCPTHDDYFLSHLEEKYGVPFVIRHMPVGIANTGMWLRDVGERLGLGAEAAALAEKEEKETREALAEFLPHFKGKRAFLSAGEYRSLATASLLRELGFEIVGIRSFHYDEYAEVELDKLRREKGDFTWSVANVQPFEEANLLKRIKPDLFIGHWHGNNNAGRLGIPTHVIYNTAYGYVGYRGAYDLARRLFRKLRNPAFTGRIGRHARLPYRESWYGREPFSFIRSGTGETA
ncbi:MAG: nitrogenase component 1 [Planctomycetota bacterium]|jgi:nitrogenase molybdenum-iron protein alpha chain|nr:nitrogenase component 1 [Planctomycetota bacterium]